MLAVTVILLALVGGAPAAAARPARADVADPGGTFVTLAAQRLTDGTATFAHVSELVPVLGVAGVPSTGVSAVQVTVTVTGATAGGYLTAYPSGTSRPPVSTLNFIAHRSVANSATLPVGADGRIAVYNGSAGTARIIVDVTGYFRSGIVRAAGAFTPQPPRRIVDTRAHLGGSRVAARGTLHVQTGLMDGQLLVNVTVTRPAAGGYLSAYPDYGPPPPGTADLNFIAGQTIASQVLASPALDGRVAIYNGSAGAVDVIVDVVGAYSSADSDERGVPGTLAAMTGRLLDTRLSGQGGPLAYGTPRRLDLPVSTVPAGAAAAALLHVTVTRAVGNDFLDAYPAGAQPSGTSKLNYVAGESIGALVTVPVSADNAVDLIVGRLSSTGSALPAADVVVDLVGFVRSGPGVLLGSLSGAVTVGPSGGGLGSVTVHVYDGTAEIGTTTTGSGTGTWTISGLSPTTSGYAVCFDGSTATRGDDTFESRCYEQQAWDAAGPPARFDPVTVTGGTTHGGVDAVLADITAPTGSISGRVTGVGGAPLADVRVSLTSDGYVLTAADGTYVIPNVRPGNRAVCFDPAQLTTSSANGYQQRCYHDADPSRADATPVPVTLGRRTSGIDQRLPVGGAVAGTVTAQDGTPLSAVAVEVRDPATHARLTDLVPSAGDGTYRVVGLPEQAVEVCFLGYNGRGGPSSYGYLGACYRSGATGTATPVPVHPGATTTVGSTALDPAGGINGLVTDAVTGKPIFHAEVQVYADPAQEEIGNDYTDTPGTFAYRGLAPGSYYVCVATSDTEGPNGRPYQRRCFGTVAFPGNPVTVHASQSTTTNFALQRG